MGSRSKVATPPAANAAALLACSSIRELLSGLLLLLAELLLPACVPLAAAVLVMGGPWLPCSLMNTAPPVPASDCLLV